MVPWVACATLQPPNRDDSHALHRLVDGLFAQLQETLASDVDEPVAFKTLLIGVANDFGRAPRGAALEILQTFDVPSGTPFSSKMHSFKVVVECTVDKGGPLTLSPEMAMELIHICTAKQYLMLMTTLFPGNLATRKRPYDSLATSWTIFALLKHNTSPAINVDALPQLFRARALTLIRWQYPQLPQQPRCTATHVAMCDLTPPTVF